MCVCMRACVCVCVWGGGGVLCLGICERAYVFCLFVSLLPKPNILLGEKLISSKQYPEACKKFYKGLSCAEATPDYRLASILEIVKLLPHIEGWFLSNTVYKHCAHVCVRAYVHACVCARIFVCVCVRVCVCVGGGYLDCWCNISPPSVLSTCSA